MVRLVSLLLALVTLACACAPAIAEELKPSIIPCTLWADCEYSFGIEFSDMPETAKLVSVKSSNPSVLRATKCGSEIYATDLVPLKPGKAKVTVKYKLNGKSSAISAVYTVKEYPNPMTYVKVNGQKIDIKAQKYYFDIFKYAKTKATVTVKPARGWKIDGTWGFTAKEGEGEDIKEFYPKSGKSFKIGKDEYCCVFFTLANTLGEDIQYGIRFYRRSE